MRSVIIKIFTVILLTIFSHFALNAQEDINTGKILSMSGNTVVVHFENMSLGLGDEVVFKRIKEIIDPVDNRVKGRTENEIATGIVEDIGLGKVYVNVITKTADISLTDKVVYTGREKKITRTTKVVGKIQELISENEIEIDVGTDEEINEGDFFLINRTENVYDPETNEITETKQIEVGRGRVSSVTESSSRAELIELTPGMELNLETDNIVFEPVLQTEGSLLVAPSEINDLHLEIEDLKQEVQLLRATVDSLGVEHQLHRGEFDTLKNEIERVFSSLMKSDMVGSKILLKNDEPITPDISQKLWHSYKQALDDCLDHKFEDAISEFQLIMEQYPSSKLTENCRYWIAQSYFNMQNYQNALDGFSAVIEDTRFNHKDDDASIMLGITFYKMGNTTEALVEFQKFIVNYPESEYKDKVNYWIQRLS